MSGYEHLSLKEAESVWDKERMLDVKADPCDLYDVCNDCPNLSDCFGIQPFEARETYYPRWFWYRKPEAKP